ncbi:antibiotic biosynthesis monooxygenase [Alphaproteobacteria bacterium]|nr:antibiotic biosynthesis monooxygenase [Alphaproteobacteria bacterium]
MFVITVKFVINEKDIEKFKVRMLQQARDSLELEKDCHQFDVCHDPNKKNIVFLYETYTDKNAFNIHLNSKHYLAFNDEVTSWVKEKIVTQLEKQAL